MNDVFQFVRVEDSAYDKPPAMATCTSPFGTGPDAARAGHADFRSRTAASEDGADKKVRRSELPPVLVGGADNPVKTPNEIHSENLESTATASS